MKSRVLSALALCVVLSSLSAAQPVKVVRVGVAAEQYLNHATLLNWTGDALRQRDLVVSYLNRRKPAKANWVIEAVSISTMDSNGVEAEALRKGCDYVVRLDLDFSSIPRTEASEFDDSNHGASVMYSIWRVSDGAPVASEFAFAFRSQAAMSVMTDIYDAIVKAAAP